MRTLAAAALIAILVSSSPVLAKSPGNSGPGPNHNNGQNGNHGNNGNNGNNGNGGMHDDSSCMRSNMDRRDAWESYQDRGGSKNFGQWMQGWKMDCDDEQEDSDD